MYVLHPRRHARAARPAVFGRSRSGGIVAAVAAVIALAPALAVGAANAAPATAPTNQAGTTGCGPAATRTSGGASVRVTPCLQLNDHVLVVSAVAGFTSGVPTLPDSWGPCKVEVRLRDDTIPTTVANRFFDCTPIANNKRTGTYGYGFHPVGGHKYHTYAFWTGGHGGVSFPGLGPVNSPEVTVPADKVCGRGLITGVETSASGQIRFHGGQSVDVEFTPNTFADISVTSPFWPSIHDHGGASPFRPWHFKTAVFGTPPIYYVFTVNARSLGRANLAVAWTARSYVC